MQLGQGVAFVEGKRAQTCHGVRKNRGLQAFAELEGAAADHLQPCAEGDGRQRRTAVKGMRVDGCHGIGDRDGRQTSAAGKGILPDGCNRSRYGDRGQGRAAAEQIRSNRRRTVCKGNVRERGVRKHVLPRGRKACGNRDRAQVFATSEAFLTETGQTLFKRQVGQPFTEPEAAFAAACHAGGDGDRAQAITSVKRGFTEIRQRGWEGQPGNAPALIKRLFADGCDVGRNDKIPGEAGLKKGV